LPAGGGRQQSKGKWPGYQGKATRRSGGAAPPECGPAGTPPCEEESAMRHGIGRARGRRGITVLNLVLLVLAIAIAVVLVVRSL